MSPVLDQPHPNSKLLISRGQGYFKLDATKFISSHHYNRKLQILFQVPQGLPDTGIDEISTLLAKHIFKYQQIVTTLTKLIDFDFLDEYIRKNDFMMLTCDSTLDVGDVIAITPNGKMILNLTKDTYERAGLNGTKSKFHHLRHDVDERYQVIIDLNSPSFKPKSKFYDRVLWSLSHTILATPRQCLISCYSKITGEFIEIPSSNFKTYETVPQISQSEGLMVPDIKKILKDQDSKKFASMSKEGKEVENDKLEDLFEWLGMVAIESSRIEFMSQVNPFICVYEPPETSTGPHNILKVKWERGFIHANGLQKIVQDLQSIIMKYTIIPWAAFMVWGFSDSPVSWDKYEHGYDSSGENDYACFFHQDKGWIIYQAVGSFDAAA